jgi:hypothetical protein
MIYIPIVTLPIVGVKRTEPYCIVIHASSPRAAEEAIRDAGGMVVDWRPADGIRAFPHFEDLCECDTCDPDRVLHQAENRCLTPTCARSRHHIGDHT